MDRAKPKSEAPNTTLALLVAVVTTMLFCQPLGVAAVFVAIQAKNAVEEGDLARARSKLVLTYALCAVWLVLGIAGWILGLLLFSAELVAIYYGVTGSSPLP